MRLRVTDSKRGILVIDLRKLGAGKPKNTMEDEELVEYNPPPLWIPKPENHDPKGRNER